MGRGESVWVCERGRESVWCVRESVCWCVRESVCWCMCYWSYFLNMHPSLMVFVVLFPFVFWFVGAY